MNTIAVVVTAMVGASIVVVIVIVIVAVFKQLWRLLVSLQILALPHLLSSFASTGGIDWLAWTFALSFGTDGISLSLHIRFPKPP